MVPNIVPVLIFFGILGAGIIVNLGPSLAPWLGYAWVHERSAGQVSDPDLRRMDESQPAERLRIPA